MGRHSAPDSLRCSTILNGGGWFFFFFGAGTVLNGWKPSGQGLISAAILTLVICWTLEMGNASLIRCQFVAIGWSWKLTRRTYCVSTIAVGHLLHSKRSYGNAILTKRRRVSRIGYVQTSAKVFGFAGDIWSPQSNPLNSIGFPLWVSSSVKRPQLIFADGRLKNSLMFFNDLLWSSSEMGRGSLIFGRALRQLDTSTGHLWAAFVVDLSIVDYLPTICHGLTQSQWYFEGGFGILGRRLCCWLLLIAVGGSMGGFLSLPPFLLLHFHIQVLLFLWRFYDYFSAGFDNNPQPSSSSSSSSRSSSSAYPAYTGGWFFFCSSGGWERNYWNIHQSWIFLFFPFSSPPFPPSSSSSSSFSLLWLLLLLFLFLFCWWRPAAGQHLKARGVVSG